jgi:heme/copper-type cytochrome/quinol oxidase subunit 2
MKSLFLIVLVLITNISWACDACKKLQPSITKDLTHGTGPESFWDWIWVIIILIIAISSLVVSVKYLLYPGEKRENHIKNLILDERN